MNILTNFTGREGCTRNWPASLSLPGHEILPARGETFHRRTWPATDGTSSPKATDFTAHKGQRPLCRCFVQENRSEHLNAEMESNSFAACHSISNLAVVDKARR